MIDVGGWFQLSTVTPVLGDWFMRGAALCIIGLQGWIIKTGLHLVRITRELREGVTELSHHLFGVRGNNGLSEEVGKLWIETNKQRNRIDEEANMSAQHRAATMVDIAVIKAKAGIVP